MDVFEAIERRHSVRAYLPDPVPEEKLARTARLRKKMEEIASLAHRNAHSGRKESHRRKRRSNWRKGINENSRQNQSSPLMIRARNFRLTVILKKETEDGYSVQVVELLGCISQGENRNEALTNIREAIEGYMEAFPEEIDRLRHHGKAIS